MNTVKQLKALRQHCLDMADEEETDVEFWDSSAEALDEAIPVMKAKRKADKEARKAYQNASEANQGTGKADQGDPDMSGLFSGTKGDAAKAEEGVKPPEERSIHLKGTAGGKEIEDIDADTVLFIAMTKAEDYDKNDGRVSIRSGYLGHHMSVESLPPLHRRRPGKNLLTDLYEDNPVEASFALYVIGDSLEEACKELIEKEDPEKVRKLTNRLALEFLHTAAKREAAKDERN